MKRENENLKSEIGKKGVGYTQNMFSSNFI